MVNNCYQESNINEVKKSCKDVFHAFMVKGAKFDGYYDMPTIPQNCDLEIKKLVPYDKTYRHNYNPGEVVHFYLYDQLFDGTKGIWNALANKESFKHGFTLERFKGSTAVITPDFSLYLDMPRVMQIWNVYRSRAVGYYLFTLGYNVIPNVRWTDDESYKYAFDGLEPGMIVSVGTLGCSKENQDIALFINGFVEMIKRIRPRLVLIYGPIINELNTVIKRFSVNVIQFDSEIANYYRRNENGNEM